MDDEAKKRVRAYVNSNPPLHGKDIDFMGGLPSNLKKSFPKSATDTDVGSGRGRGDAVIGSGPGGAAATARDLGRVANGDAELGKALRAHEGVRAQKRSIDQLKEIRAIYKNAFSNSQKNKNKAKNKLKMKPPSKDEAGV